MTIDKYLQKDGTYLIEGVTYESAQDVFQIMILGFCACGDPDGALKHIRRALQQVKNQNVGVHSAWVEDTKALLGGDDNVWFMWYYLDKEEFTEHGGSVPGWLTTKGEELLSDLDEYFKEG